MKDMQHILPEIGYFFIASAGWLLRYLSNIVGWRIVYNFKDAAVWVSVAWLLGVLAWWIAPAVTDNVDYQKAFVYVAWMLSIEIIKIIINKIPDIINRKIDKWKNEW